MKHPFLIVMKALMIGKTVKLGNNTYGMSEDGMVGIVMEDKESLLCFKDGPSVNWLIEAASKLPESEVICIAASIALTEINNDKRRM
jgi:hypothetical protein